MDVKATAKAKLKALATPPPREAHALWLHFSATYLSIRRGLALLAFALPVVLYVVGRLLGLEWQPSLSAYFWAADSTQCASFPLRSVFVGLLLAIAVGLHLYKGLTDLENWLLNAAAVCAAVVALVPERLDKLATLPREVELYAACPAVKAWAESQTSGLPWHYMAAVGMFVCLFFVSLKCARLSLDYLPKNAPRNAAWFERWYRRLAWAMPLWGAASGVWVWMTRDQPSHAVFVLEWGAIWIFSAYWALKTYEMSLTRLEADPQTAVEHAEENAEERADDSTSLDLPTPRGAP